MSSDLHLRLKNRLAIVRADLDQVISRLDDSLLDWAPREGMRTVKGQLLEIAGTERQLMEWIQQEREMPYQEAMDFGARSNTLTGLVSVLADVRTGTLAYLDSLTVDQLTTPRPFPHGWFESLRMDAVPLEEPIRSLAQHEWYHVGQLVSYLWSRGDDPYKW